MPRIKQALKTLRHRIETAKPRVAMIQIDGPPGLVEAITDTILTYFNAEASPPRKKAHYLVYTIILVKG